MEINLKERPAEGAPDNLRSKESVKGGFIKTALRILPLIGLAGIVWFMIWAYRAGILTDEEAMRDFVDRFGIWGPVIFIFLQFAQVIVPCVPGSIGCLMGVIMFGTWRGLLFNYIGICAGSVVVFLIAKHYGRPLMHKVFSEKLIARYEKWTETGNRFTKLFAGAIFFPVAPDDFLCYLAGTTGMKLRTFTTIILLGKPLSIFIYSLGLNLIFEAVLGMAGA